MFTISPLPFTFAYFSEISWRLCDANPGPFALWSSTLTTTLLYLHTPHPNVLFSMADLCDNGPELAVARPNGPQPEV